MKAEQIDSETVCHTCEHSAAWHIQHRPRHLFNDGTLGASSALGKKQKESVSGGDQGHDGNGATETAPWPIDPVLRVALINAGIITPDDLRKAEELIRATTATFNAAVKESRGGQ